MKENCFEKKYEPPEMAVCLAEVERGFGDSSGGATTPGWKVVSDLRDEEDLYNF